MSIYSIFCFLFSVQCVASFLIYYTLLSTALKTELLTSLWPFLLGSALQFFTNVNASTLTTPEMMFYYYLNFTVGYNKQLACGTKYSLNLSVQDKTLILHSTPCVPTTSPPTCCSSNWSNLRTSHQTPRPLETRNHRLPMKSRDKLTRATYCRNFWLKQWYNLNPPKLPSLGGYSLSFWSSQWKSRTPGSTFHILKDQLLLWACSLKSIFASPSVLSHCQLVPIAISKRSQPKASLHKLFLSTSRFPPMRFSYPRWPLDTWDHSHLHLTHFPSQTSSPGN